MSNIKTKILKNQLIDDYVISNLIGVADGIASLDENTKINLNNLPDITGTTSIIKEASLTQKGISQLSNSYKGSSETTAITEKALSDGLNSIRTFYTDSNMYRVSNGDITVGQTVMNLSDKWPSADLYGILVFRNGLYQNSVYDFDSDSISKTITLHSAITSGETVTVVFESILNIESLGSNLFYGKLEVDNLLNLKAPINNPVLTGNPKAPTLMDVTDSSASIATSKFVHDAFSYYIDGKKIIVSSVEPTGIFNDGDIWINTATAQI